MLSPEELLDAKNKPAPVFYSLGQKESEHLNSTFYTAQLDLKLKNMEEHLSVERVRMVGVLSKAVWCPELKHAKVTKKLGPYWETLGHSIGSQLYLNPEEALYLIDIGALELTFNGVPVSLQRAFFLLLHDTGVSMNQYRVFSHLSVLGYKVVRHSAKNVLTKYEKNIEVHKIGVKHRDVTLKDPETVSKPPVNEHQTVYSNLGAFPIQYDAEDSKSVIMERLQAIGPSTDDGKSSEKNVVIDFDVFLPAMDDQTPFRKSTVQLPNFRICVFSCDDPVPELGNMSMQRHCFQDEVPLIHAIVYADFISFLQISAVSLPIIT